jgi:hypothetical protein
MSKTSGVRIISPRLSKLLEVPGTIHSVLSKCAMEIEYCFIMLRKHMEFKSESYIKISILGFKIKKIPNITIFISIW